MTTPLAERQYVASGYARKGLMWRIQRVDVRAKKICRLGAWEAHKGRYDMSKMTEK